MESFPAGIGALRGSGRLQCHFRWHPQMPRQLPELVAPATGRFLAAARVRGTCHWSLLAASGGQ